MLPQCLNEVTESAGVYSGAIFTYKISTFISIEDSFLKGTRLKIILGRSLVGEIY